MTLYFSKTTTVSKYFITIKVPEVFLAFQLSIQDLISYRVGNILIYMQHKDISEYLQPKTINAVYHRG